MDRAPVYNLRRGMLLPALLLLAACGQSDREAASVATYRSPSSAFSFDYPDSLSLRPYGPSFVSVGREQGQTFISAAEVGVEEGESESFEAFAVERARVSCAADGPDLSLQCTTVQMLQPVSTANGLEGIAFYLEHVATRPGSGEVVETGGRGPFFFFDLSPAGQGGAHRAIFVRAPAVLPPEEVDSEMIRGIAQSLQVSGATFTLWIPPGDETAAAGRAGPAPTSPRGR